MTTTILPEGPASHSLLVMSGNWTAPCPYIDTVPPVPSASPAAKTAGFVRFEWAVVAPVPPEATSVKMRFKLKADCSAAPTGSIIRYAQANLRFVNPDTNPNHFMHVEDYANTPGPAIQGRRVTYTTADMPIRDGKIIVDVAREIINQGVIEFGGYLEGYTI